MMASRKVGFLGLALVGAGLSLAVPVGPTAARAQAEAAHPCAAAHGTSSFMEWPGVSEARRITRIDYVGKAPMHRTAGVQLYVPARAGLSAESLQQLAECQMARAAAQGGADALALPGLRAEVTPRGAGYRVTLTTRDVAVAQELVRRATL